VTRRNPTGMEALPRSVWPLLAQILFIAAARLELAAASVLISRLLWRAGRREASDVDLSRHLQLSTYRFLGTAELGFHFPL
jgi:hypothetical protein